MSIFPRGLTGRTVLVLLVAVTLVHVGSMLIYEQGPDHVMEPWHQADIRGRLEAARNVLAGESPAKRPAMAAMLSSENFQIAWGAGGIDRELPSPPIADLRSGPLGSTGTVLLDDLTVLHYRLPMNSYGGHATNATLSSTTVMVLGVIAVAALLIRGIVAPLRQLAQAADSIGHTIDIAPIAERGPHEVRLVARAFNAMQERIGRLVGDRTQALAAVSHDLRTPITRLRLRAGFIVDLETRTSIDRDLDDMETMVDSTLAYLSGEQEIESSRLIDLPALLQTLIDAEIDDGHIASYEGPAHLTVVSRPFSLKRAFANLITNAIVYGSCARVRLSLGGVNFVVTIDDDGPGIPENDVKRVFDPFVRLENSRNRNTGGTGLGLTIARRAIISAGGTLKLENRLGGGLTTRVELPISMPAGYEAKGDTAEGGPSESAQNYRGHLSFEEAERNQSRWRTIAAVFAEGADRQCRFP